MTKKRTKGRRISIKVTQVQLQDHAEKLKQNSIFNVSRFFKTNKNETKAKASFETFKFETFKVLFTLQYLKGHKGK